jgi:hypothetical protein
MLTLHRKDGTLVDPETILVDFKGASWIYDSVTHPRKVNVRQGPKDGFYPDTWRQQFYPAVFDVVIRDIDTGYHWPPINVSRKD